MQVITTTTDRKNVYISSFRSEYLSDVLAAVTEMENDYVNERKHIEQLASNVDMDAADCLYYTMEVTYYTKCKKTAEFAARLVEIAAENAAWVAEQADRKVNGYKKVTAPKPVVVNGIIVANPDFKDPRMTGTVGKFVKGMWNNETEDNMWYWIRTNREKFPEYANALESTLGEEHDKLDWQGMDED